MHTPLSTLILGDSISDGGWERDPTGMGSAWPAAAARLSQERGLPARKWINRAQGGSRSVEILEAWEKGDFPIPHTLVVMVGANDLWRSYVPWLDHAPVAPIVFGQNLSRLLYAAQEAGVKELQVCTPTALHAAPQHPWNAALEEYRGWCHEIADACDAMLIPTGEEWMEALAACPEVRWSYDGVHPRPVGHERLARTWLTHALGAPPLAPHEIPTKPSTHRLGAWP